MDLKVHNKTALVTGSTAGIGFAIAQLLAEEGATVVINGRTPERVADAIKKIKSSYPAAKLISAPADLSDKKGIDAVIEQIPVVDILVNNFGIYEVKQFNDISDDDWLRLFNANVMSGIRLCRHYLNNMFTKNWGRVIFISSESGLQVPVEMIHYGMTKTAQLAVSRGLAEMTIGTNVTVNSILPGPTSTEGVKEFIISASKEQKKTPKQVESELFTTMRPSSLLQRFAAPEEVATMVAFLCSPLSSATNGAAVRVEGGIIRAIA
ncbi:SDR family NAD(P)-dependent oxidoreductase [Legionella fallonii]|uniref:Uncharacterized oxidoreductase YvaG n=1 Tax=Legionella fallonii LLAP-10 TaxID=1212491 RepID=A0A098G6G5_9GAMM|nr:SDR family oxidoreductase [Legionella fallonii]CEG57576.1 Uncharacterized oxidoreductase YvaG [Legionella fallonii LLAP-10]